MFQFLGLTILAAFLHASSESHTDPATDEDAAACGAAISSDDSDTARLFGSCEQECLELLGAAKAMCLRACKL